MQSDDERDVDDTSAEQVTDATIDNSTQSPEPDKAPKFIFV